MIQHNAESSDFEAKPALKLDANSELRARSSIGSDIEAISLDLRNSDEEKIQRSLFGEILDWMLVPLLLLWPMSIAITYLVAKSIANQAYDRALEDKVLVLSQQVRQVDGKILSQMNHPATDILRADEFDSIYFQIKSENGTLIDGDADFSMPQEDEKPNPGLILFRNEKFHGVDLRVAYGYVALKKNLSGSTAVSNGQVYLALVQVAETLEKRAVLANDIIKGVILPQFVILPIALALVWFALSRGLSPLLELQQRINARKPDDLSSIDTCQVPEEISPLVRSLNEMLARVSQTIDIQKRFIADAAHQMKTPLAGMRMQSELALRQTDQAEIMRSLLQISKSSEAATRLINQLLTLARAENQSTAKPVFELIELSELARNTVHDWIQTSFSSQIDLGFEQADEPIHIFANAVMLRELLSNLIDNALRYTPKNHAVTVRTRYDSGQQLGILEVEDSGVGIQFSEREHVFKRFYRTLGSNVQGSGLGLAIVAEIARQHDAQIMIVDTPHPHSAEFPGCIFRISFRINPFIQSNHYLLLE